MKLGEDYPGARERYEESLAIFKELGDKQGIASLLNNLGDVAAIQGDYAAARELYVESLEISRELGVKQEVAYSLEAFASLAIRQEQWIRAIRLWAAAEILRETIGSPLPPNYKEEYDLRVAEARTALGEPAFSAAWDAGQAMTIEQAIEYALEDDGRV